MFETHHGNIGYIARNESWKHITAITDPQLIAEIELPSHTMVEDAKARGVNPNAKLNAENVAEIKQLIMDGYGNGSIGRMFEMDYKVIWGIRNGKAWKHIPFPEGSKE